MTPSSVVLFLVLTVAVAANTTDVAVAANHGRYSFVVAIKSHGVVACNGAILSQHWVVTTAHCLVHIEHSSNTTEVVTVGGDHVYKYRRHAIFPNYYSDQPQDFGLLRIQGYFKFYNKFRPGQLAAEPFPKSPVNCQSVGWVTMPSGELILLKTHLNPITRGGCYKYRFMSTYIICTETVTLAQIEHKCDSNSSRVLVCRGIIAGILVGQFKTTESIPIPLTCDRVRHQNVTFEVNLYLGHFHWFIQNYVHDMMTPTPLFDTGFALRRSFTPLTLALTLVSMFTL